MNRREDLKFRGRARRHDYSFNLLAAVRDAASRLTGEFTYREVARLVEEEHPGFGDSYSYTVNNYLNMLARQGKLVRVKATDRRAHMPGVFRNAGEAGHPVLEQLDRNSPAAFTTVKDESS
jgi:hypothetical protein